MMMIYEAYGWLPLKDWAKLHLSTPEGIRVHLDLRRNILSHFISKLTENTLI